MAFECINYVADGGTTRACPRADRDAEWFRQQGSAEPYQATANGQGRDKQ